MDHVTHEYSRFTVSTDPVRLDVGFIHRELSQSYWAAGIPRAIVEKSLRYSLCFGAYAAGSGAQVGFARVVSDHATFAFIGDVVITEAWRGRSVGKALMEAIMAHPELQNLRRYCLGTRDAHGLYEKYGFEVIKQPANWMEIKQSNPYGATRGNL